MSNSVSGNFSVPDGFSEEQIEGQIYHEDLDEDDELWLIRMPSNIELSDLDRKKICLSENSGGAKIKDIKTEDGKLLECYTEKCEIPNVCVILPQRSDESLHAVKKVIKGTILISEGLVLGDDIEVKSENEQKETTLELKKKKDKKKKRHTNDFDKKDLNYDTEDAETVTSTIHNKRVKKHSGLHKKSKSESIEVKNEPHSMNYDVFPHCVSQK